MANSTAMLPRLSDYIIEPLHLGRDWHEIDRLLQAEDWPFVRADFEASHQQPHSVGFVAKLADSPTLAGFFVAHHFDRVGYFDMMVVDKTLRKSKLATKLGYETRRALLDHGMRGFVAHSTNDSFDVFRFFGYERGIDFTLMRREPADALPVISSLESITLGKSDFDLIVDLDAGIFGQRRETWIRTLINQPETRFVGIKQDGRLIASACLRHRRENALCLDSVNAHSFEHLAPLLTQILHALPTHRLECFARTDSDLHRWLKQQGWFVPDFFAEIGPLVEWRKGETCGTADSRHIRSLNWF